MTVDVTLWAETFSEEEIPPFTCPVCQKGALALVKDCLKIIESERSKKAFREREDWEPDWVECRFSLFLECSSPKCGELVVMSGDTVQVYENTEHGAGYVPYLRPRSIFPAPPIIRLLEEIPSEVREELEQAFLLFWSDQSASANRLRTSLERVLDALQIKKYNRKGKRVSIPLGQRMGLFEKEHGTDFKDIFTALRTVGNLGSHAKVTRTALLAAFEIYEHALDEIFGKRKKKIEGLSKKLIKSKGKLEARQPLRRRRLGLGVG
jgi:hypothetical protein